MTIAARGKKGLYSVRVRVPVKYAEVEKRGEIWVALNTDSRSEAERRAAKVRTQIYEELDAKAAGSSTDKGQRYDAARRLARARDVRFMDPEDVSRLPVEDILRRIEMVRHTGQGPTLSDAEAFLGGARAPSMTVTVALETYFSLTDDKTNGMSADQKRIWVNPRRKAISNFVAQIGDKPVEALTRDDLLDFRQWWSKRVAAGEVSTNSANKELGHLSNILSTVNELKRLGANLPLGGLTLKETDQKTRPPFSDHWIKTKLLAPGALDGLNDDARNIFCAMINTGARPSELAALLPSHIHLDAKVPYIEILPEGRHVKSAYSKRKIPLVGISLKAMQQSKDGFPRYRNKQSLSATVNKFLRANGLVESEGHVLYSLRHSFEDRMLAAGFDERIRRDLLGHRLNRERYGAGASLDHVHQLLSSIAF